MRIPKIPLLINFSIPGFRSYSNADFVSSEVTRDRWHVLLQMPCVLDIRHIKQTITYYMTPSPYMGPQALRSEMRRTSILRGYSCQCFRTAYPRQTDMKAARDLDRRSIASNMAHCPQRFIGPTAGHGELRRSIRSIRCGRPSFRTPDMDLVAHQQETYVRLLTACLRLCISPIERGRGNAHSDVAASSQCHCRLW